MAAIIPRAGGNGCTVQTCDVSQSTYGYYPSRPSNITFLAIFVISLLLHIFQGVRWKSWSFLVALGVGTLMEAVGYYGRIRLYNDPFNRANLGINIVCLTVAPAFIAAGIYLTLKHSVIVFGVQYSRFDPKWYTRIFIACDIVSIILQATGAALSAGTNGNQSKLDTANRIMETGIVSQVVTLLIFGYLGGEIAYKVDRDAKHGLLADDKARALRGIRGPAVAIVVAYTTILIRCVYRIAEMAGGWRNSIMQDQWLFVVLDGVMCVIAVLILNVFHPGWIFRQSRLALQTLGSGTPSTELEMPGRAPAGRREK